MNEYEWEEMNKRNLRRIGEFVCVYIVKVTEKVNSIKNRMVETKELYYQPKDAQHHREPDNLIELMSL